MNNWDVIVVGAGPSGTTAARICAENNLKVLIIDKSSFPRDKSCGGGLSLGAVQELDMPIPENIIERTCYGLHSRFRGKEALVSGKKPVAYMINRRNFDDFLLKKAIESGAVFAKRNCLSVEESSDRVTLETDDGIFECSICIGADGYFSKTAKSVRDKFSIKEIRFCLVCNIKGKRGDQNSVELDFGFIPYGYGWLFPKSDYISAGIGGSFESGKNLKKFFENFLNSQGLKTSDPFKGCFIPVSNLKHKINTKRIMLTGDAAGFVDSFSGEGIKNAIISGRIAAETAFDSLHNKVPTSRYRRRIYSVIASDLIWSLRISRLSNRFENLVFGNLLSNQNIMTKYFQVMQNEKSYRSFFWETALSFPLILLKKIIRSSFINR